MIMIASFATAGLAVLLAFAMGGGAMLIISGPGFIVGVFFAFRYLTFDTSRARQEEHRRSRRKH